MHVAASGRHLVARRRPRAVSRHVRTDGLRALAALGGYAALAPVALRDPGGRDRGGLRRVNHSGEGAFTPLRLPQQLGTPWVLPGLALTGFLTRRPHLAVTAALALPMEKGLEVGVKRLSRRPRPAQTVPDAELHDDAPSDGPSYPSGHTAIAVAAVVLAAPYLEPLLLVALALTALATAAARVHQGAHYPGDAAGGALLGAGVGYGLRFVVGQPVGDSVGQAVGRRLLAVGQPR